ncbi:hypothetical protein E4K67_22600 [Desulfosporosinus fructosivorans]|uniref:Uncharacterized protein n=1 Tax=Desulfosporosinus fructosivorans TaxID=2018669 RepID=A0A4Z0R049_9FIRM|nr:hypothetical protein [Desulfosporosinus fructosivorans]TGE35909.1 hypothetical protein E4K67_22600 [Desulfosporosinus fructosivorans]
MSHMKIASKILEVMKAISSEQEFGKLNEAIIEQKLITKVEYEIEETKESITSQRVVWQLVTVSCELTIIDVESDEILVNVAYGSGMDQGDKAVAKAQDMAQRFAWMAALNIESREPVVVTIKDGEVVTPEFVVETPESKLIAHIKALWKWDTALFPDYALQRFKKPIEQLNISELSVLKNELENYGR